MTSKELLRTKRSTPLEIEIERDLVGGLRNVKDRLTEVHGLIDRKNQAAEEMEKEISILYQGYLIATEKQRDLYEQIHNGEARLNILTTTMEGVSKSLQTKEEYLRELLAFRVGESIEEANERASLLKESNGTYKANHQKLQEGRRRKTKLEEKYDMMERRLETSMKKMKKLNDQLNELRVEEERQEKECKKLETMAQSSSIERDQKQLAMDAVRHNLGQKMKQVDGLKKQISHKKMDIKQVVSERQSIEASIKQIVDCAVREFDKIENIDT